MAALAIEHCARLHGGSVRDCACMLPDQGGWLECPPEARGVLEPVPVEIPAPATKATVPQSFSGDICATCGSPDMIRTGTCLTCRNCGDTSGGCS